MRTSQGSLAIALGGLLISASLLKLWAQTRYPTPAEEPWVAGSALVDSVVIFEAVFGRMLVAGFWPRAAWYASVAVFGLFAIVTAVEAARGESSCGCFGVVQVKPIYTMCLDMAAVVVLVVTGRPSRGVRGWELGAREEDGDRGSAEGGRGLGVGRWALGFGERGGSEATGGSGEGSRLTSNFQPATSNPRAAIAVALGAAWLVAVGAMWLTRPAIAVTTASVAGQEFGKPGELVVLEPEKWAGQKFSLADHIDIGSQLNSGQWIVLLVHHDCDHCAAAVPRYIAACGVGRGSEVGGREEKGRLAVIEVPPFGDPADPPAWSLPPPVLAGRLDQTRDWFATTPVALLIKDGIIISGKEGEHAETPDPLLRR